MRTDVVIATALPTRAHGGERVLQIARWLTRRGVAVEIIALGEGTRPELAEFDAVAPTIVVDRFRRRGLALAPHLLGQRRLTTGWKRMRLQRMMERRQDATFVIHDPVAASLLRYAPVPPRRVIAAFPDPTWSLERMRPEDRETLMAADGWITSDGTQSAEVHRCFDGPVLNLGDALGAGTLIDRAELPPVRRADGVGGSVVLLGASGSWEAVDHAIEVAWLLHHLLPEVAIRWVVDAEDDRWLAGHDLAHAGLTDAVDLRSGSDPSLLDGIAAVVRTGYEPTHSELALAAALGGVPVLGTCTSDLPDAAPQTEPLAVEALVAAVTDVLTDPSLRDAAGGRLRAALAHLDLEHHIGVLTDLLLPERT